MKPFHVKAGGVVWILWSAAIGAILYGYFGLIAPGEAHLEKSRAQSADLVAKAEIAQTSLKQLGTISSARRRVETALRAENDGSHIDDGTAAVKAADVAGRSAGVAVVALSLPVAAPIKPRSDGFLSRDLDLSVRGSFHGVVLFLAELGAVGVPLEVLTVQIHAHPSRWRTHRLLDATIKARLYRLAEINNGRKDNNEGSTEVP